MEYRIWCSSTSYANYIKDNTYLSNRKCTISKIRESDANSKTEFYKVPEHIKKILYLDAPDIIVECNSEPIFSIEFTTEAGTGHNAFQRFARLAAAVENDVPAFYIYPEAVIIDRKTSSKWDKINPLIFKALTDTMIIYNIPALLYYFPSDYKDSLKIASKSNHKNTKGLIFDKNIVKYSGCPDSTDKEMILFFDSINEIISGIEKNGILKTRENLIKKRNIIQRREWISKQYYEKGGNSDMSPLSATIKVPTKYLLNHLSSYESNDYKIGELLRNRSETIIYQVDAKFRGDPYPGALSAIDYMICREGKSFEERKYNLVLCWGRCLTNNEEKTFSVMSDKASINDFVKVVKSSETNNLLTLNYKELKPNQIPRYYMQVRYGSTYSKAKHIRVYSYFADAILFTDGALWRDA